MKREVIANMAECRDANDACKWDWPNGLVAELARHALTLADEREALHTALERIAKVDEKDCERYVAVVDGIAVDALVQLESGQVSGQATASLDKRLEAARKTLEPFANAWARRAPAGEPDSKAYQRRMDRALECFYSVGSDDDKLLLTGAHLKAADDLLRVIEGGHDEAG